jgi:secernin
MCDTQVLITPDAVWFAKNSDREPTEPQPVIRLPAVRGDLVERVHTTYLDIPQVPDRNAVILSKPLWCWGAEMGVNDRGVAIGNEAIFGKRATLVPALLGMDLVRLGLERAASAAEALDVMTRLLEAHGQGGPAGFEDQGFCYDSSFLIADAREAWVLETAGRDWAARRVAGRYAISNRLTLGGDYERSSAAISATRPDFAATFDTTLKPWLAGAQRRRALSQSCLDRNEPPSLERFTRHLRAHHGEQEDPARGSNADVCMHAHGFIRRSQTTGSMIARLSTTAGSTLLFTGTSAPCLSIFRPVSFDGDWHVLTPLDQQVEALLWRRHEWLHRFALADADLRLRLRKTRDEVEARMFELIDVPAPDATALQRADRLAAAWHKVLFESLDSLALGRPERFWLAVGKRDGIDITRHRIESMSVASRSRPREKEPAP